MIDTRRIRVWIDDNATLLAVLCLVGVVLGGWLGYSAVATANTHVETRTGTLYTTTADFEHRATVVRENPVFDRNATLENRAVYFTNLTPVLRGTFAVSYDTPHDGSLRATVTTRLVLRSVDGEGQVYWRVVRRLGHADRTLAPGDTISQSYRINTTAVENRIQRIRAQLGASPGETQILVVARVRFDGRIRFDGTVDDRSVEATRRYVQRIEPSGDTYRVSATGTGRNATSMTRRVRVEAKPSMLRRGGAAALLLTSLAGLAAVGLISVVRVEGFAPTGREREDVRLESKRAEYDEWITAASLPADVDDRPRIDVDSLEGLVDLAIDTDARVLEVDDPKRYVVLHDGIRYVYRPGSTGSRSTGRAYRRESGDDLVTIEGIGTTDARKLRERGIRSVEALAMADPAVIADGTDLDAERIRAWSDQARGHDERGGDTEDGGEAGDSGDEAEPLPWTGSADESPEEDEAGEATGSLFEDPDNEESDPIDDGELPAGDEE